jgi:hypothetical protein
MWWSVRDLDQVVQESLNLLECALNRGQLVCTERVVIGALSADARHGVIHVDATDARGHILEVIRVEDDAE